MHEQAYEWVAKHAPAGPCSVLDLGGRDINGSTRDLFPAADPYWVVDIRNGPGVDVVADAATWVPTSRFDVVVCTETFEHTASWPGICRTAFAALKPGGLFIATMAGPGRPPHSAIDGGWSLHPGEHYANVPPDELERVLASCGFTGITVDYQPQPADTRAVAYREAR